MKKTVKRLKELLSELAEAKKVQSSYIEMIELQIKMMLIECNIAQEDEDWDRLFDIDQYIIKLEQAIANYRKSKILPFVLIDN